METFKEQIKTLLKERNKENIAEMLQIISNLLTDNNVPAYRLQATWGEGFSTYSQANIAAIAVKSSPASSILFSSSSSSSLPGVLRSNFVMTNLKTK